MANRVLFAVRRENRRGYFMLYLMSLNKILKSWSWRNVSFEKGAFTSHCTCDSGGIKDHQVRNYLTVDLHYASRIDVNIIANLLQTYIYFEYMKWPQFGIGFALGVQFYECI
eukprot:scaffold34696_cov155-Skeletonema_dohrnii-CCMP3373.AAC.1